MKKQPHMFRELAHFQSPDQSILIWTVQNLEAPGDYKTLVAFPKNDKDGYRTASKASTEDQALENHRQALKKFALFRRNR